MGDETGENMTGVPDQLQLGKLSASVFFQPRDFGDKIMLSGRLIAAADGALDGEQLILPVPAQGPADLPRIQIGSSDGSRVLQVTLRRLAFEWNRRQPKPFAWSECAPPFMRSLGALMRVFVGEYASPNSFAFQCQFLHLLDRSANDYLTNFVLQPDRALDRPFMCKITIEDKMDVGGRDMSLWLNVSSARAQGRPEEDRGLAVVCDVNAPVDHARPYGAEEIMAIMAEMERQIARRVRTFLNDLFPA